MDKGVETNRIVLGNLLRKKASILSLTFLDLDQEINAINTTLISLTTLGFEFEGGPPTDSMVKRVCSRLAHVSCRIERLPIPEDRKEEADTFRDNALSTFNVLEADLFEKIRDPAVADSCPFLRHKNMYLCTNFISTS